MQACTPGVRLSGKKAMRNGAMMRPAFTLALLGLSTLALMSCANPRADEALFAQKAFIGMSKQTLLSCAGVPQRSATADNMEFYTYTSQRTVTYASPDPWIGGRY